MLNMFKPYSVLYIRRYTMNSNDDNAKDKIIKITMDMLNEVDEPDKITVRQIAQRANVGIGLINYHFQSKENLLFKAVSDTMSTLAKELQKSKDGKPENPVEKLKLMLKELVDFAIRYNKLSLILVSHTIQQGNMEVPLYLVPILKDIYGSAKDEIEIRIIALEIVSTLQVAYMNSQKFQLYIGMDINNKLQRDKLIDTVINSIIKK